jgi:hypothetical protein
VAAGAGLGVSALGGVRPRPDLAQRAAGRRAGGGVRRRARRGDDDVRARRPRRAGPVAGHADPRRGGRVGVPGGRADVPDAAQRRRPPEIYSWLLGRLATAGWHDTLLLLPYATVSATAILLLRRELDVLSVGDEEAAGLGLHPQRSRYILLGAASSGHGRRRCR